MKCVCLWVLPSRLLRFEKYAIKTCKHATVRSLPHLRYDLKSDLKSMQDIAITATPLALPQRRVSTSQCLSYQPRRRATIGALNVCSKGGSAVFDARTSRDGLKTTAGGACVLAKPLSAKGFKVGGVTTLVGTSALAETSPLCDGCAVAIAPCVLWLVVFISANWPLSSRWTACLFRSGLARCCSGAVSPPYKLVVISDSKTFSSDR